MDTGAPDESERTNDVSSYKITCIDFIRDISADYITWVDYYKLPSEEDGRRRAEIASTIRRTNDWIARVAQTIKGVDVIMNDGIQKMAEATAGRPFQLGVFVNKQSGYTAAKPGMIPVNIKAAGREGAATRLGFHFKNARFRIESTAPAVFDESNLPLSDYMMMDANLFLDASKCTRRDIISFTVTISEVREGDEADRRGASTIIHIV